MTIVTLGIAANEDDGRWGPASGFDLSPGNIELGAIYGSSSNAFLRFTGGPPQGATINNARLTIRSTASQSDIATFTIKLCDEDASGQIADETDAESRATTTGTSWPVSDAWDADEFIDSVDFAGEVQAVVNRAGYSGVLQVMVGYSTDFFVSRRFYDSFAVPGYEAQIVIDYTAGEGGGGSTGAAAIYYTTANPIGA